MKLIFTYLGSILIFLMLTSCLSENRSNARAYVEGHLKAKPKYSGKVILSLQSGAKIIAKVTPTINDRFIMSGPLLTDSFTLLSSHKIQSFSASREGCVLAADSSSIAVPAGITYLIFNEINIAE